MKNFIERGFVTYADFGAVGDGVTDDFKAIKAAHDFANENSLDVFADGDKTYYIGVNDTTAMIKTNVDWRGATFIFDDTLLTQATTKYVFHINTDEEDLILSPDNEFVKKLIDSKDSDGVIIKSINHGDKKTVKLDLGLGYPALLAIYDSNTEMYVRYGYPDGQVHTQEEIVLVDKDGNIDPTTPFLCDYKGITGIRVQRLDTIRPISVKNATIISKSTKMNRAGNINHGIRLSRSYATLEGIKHRIIEQFGGQYFRNNNSRTPIRYDESVGHWVDVSGEGYTISGWGANYKVLKDGEEYTGGDVSAMMGVTYTGIVAISFSESVTLKDCEFQARNNYGGGTYDLNLYYANNTKFINCIQTNFFDKSTDFLYTPCETFPNMSLCWGVFGSNYGKNLVFDGCKLTRFDAHCGVFNAKMTNCTFSLIRLIGGGEFVLDNVDFYFGGGGAVVQLREDYGATFNGTVVVKDSRIHATQKFAGLVSGPTALWDNGYDLYFPNVVVDNIKLMNTQTELNIAMQVTGQSFEASRYVKRDPITEPVHDKNALFTLYYNTRNPNIALDKPDKFYYLKGRERLDLKPEDKDALATLTPDKYAVVDFGNGTYTVIAPGVPNFRPYNAPRFIEVKNMKNFTNINGEKVSLRLYNSDFFKNTEIIDEDGVIETVDPK